MIAVFEIWVPLWFPAAVAAVLSVAVLGWLVYKWMAKVGFRLRRPGSPQSWNSP